MADFLDRINRERDRRAAEYQRILARFQAQYPDEDMAQLADWVEDEMDGLDQQEYQERAERRDQIDDSPCLENGRDNCDDWGTGEGRYHGRI